MYSLFSGANENYTLEENIHKMSLTSTQASFLSVKQSFARINNNFDFARGYYKSLKHEIGLDKLLFEEYLYAKKKRKEQFVQAYETWKANSLLTNEFLYTTAIQKYNAPINIDSLFNEGRAQSNEIPKFFKDIFWDFMIFIAFFLKFLKRMSD
jgi:hypothetical protein